MPASLHIDVYISSNLEQWKSELDEVTARIVSMADEDQLKRLDGELQTISDDVASYTSQLQSGTVPEGVFKTSIESELERLKAKKRTTV